MATNTTSTQDGIGEHIGGGDRAVIADQLTLSGGENGIKLSLGHAILLPGRRDVRVQAHFRGRPDSAPAAGAPAASAPATASASAAGTPAAGSPAASTPARPQEVFQQPPPPIPPVHNLSDLSPFDQLEHLEAIQAASEQIFARKRATIAKRFSSPPSDGSKNRPFRLYSPYERRRELLETRRLWS